MDVHNKVTHKYIQKTELQKKKKKKTQKPSNSPGWSKRLSNADLSEVRSCCRWLVLSRQNFRSSMAALDSGKSEQD